MEQYNWYLYSTAAHYGPSPVFLLGSELAKTHGFTSLYAVTESTAKAIHAEGTTRGFKGAVWSPYIWLDFDSTEHAERAGSRLEEMGIGFNAYTTGNRGLHFRLDRSTTNSPSHLLPARDKQYIRDNFTGADLSIYTHLHPFRMEGTKHEKTGRRKERIYFRAGNKVDVPPLKEEAITTYPHQGQSRTSVFDSFKLMANTVPVTNGSRQYFLIRQLYALKECGASSEFALEWIQNWNMLLEEPKDDAELEKALRSIYR